MRTWGHEDMGTWEDRGVTRLPPMSLCPHVPMSLCPYVPKSPFEIQRPRRAVQTALNVRLHGQATQASRDTSIACPHSRGHVPCRSGNCARPMRGHIKEWTPAGDDALMKRHGRRDAWLETHRGSAVAARQRRARDQHARGVASGNHALQAQPRRERQRAERVQRDITHIKRHHAKPSRRQRTARSS